MNKFKTIGFIGGKGQMAKVFIPVFKKYGFKILISDTGTKLTNIELVQKADIVIITVPILQTIKVIKEIVPYTRKDQIIMDLTSLKSEPVKEMLKGKAEVIGLHPMFGPTIPNLKNQRIIICPARTSNKKFIQNLLEQEGLNTHITSPENHDRIMGIIQVLIHFHSILLGNTLKDLKPELKELEKYMSPIYELEFGVIARIFSQDPNLYGPILMQNPEKEKILDKMTKNTKKLSQIISKSDQKTFNKIFEETKRYLGNYSEKAAKNLK